VGRAPTAIVVSCLMSCLVTVSPWATTDARADSGDGALAGTGVAHRAVRGVDLRQVDVVTVAQPGRVEHVAWGDLAAPRAPGRYRLRWSVSDAGDAGGASSGGVAAAIEVPVCAGRGAVALDGAPIAPGGATGGAGPVIVPLRPAGANGQTVDGTAPRIVTVEATVSPYERRIACGAPARVGSVVLARDGLLELTFASPHAARGGGKAALFIPPGHDAARPAAVLVGAHPWNGGPWTYAAYAELIEEAAARDVVLLMPAGLGNSLYTAPAEDEVMRAIDALAVKIAVDPRRTSIWGASMGGAGATTIGFHRPDRFASVTSLFGDSAYDLTTYVRAILPDDAAAHRVNALDVAENARHLPVWLIHGEEDRVSPIVQSAQLAQALEAQGFAVRFDRVPHAGHEGPLVARFARAIVARASEARAPASPARVTYRSVRTEDTGAYGVRLVRLSRSERGAGGDAWVDIEAREGAIHLRRAGGVHAVVLAPGALGTGSEAPPKVVVEAGARGVLVEWETPAPAAR
jgi:predicted esterase